MAPPVVRTIENIKYENVGPAPAGFSMPAPISGYASASDVYLNSGVASPGYTSMGEMPDSFRRFMRARIVRKEAAKRQ